MGVPVAFPFYRGGTISPSIAPYLADRGSRGIALEEMLHTHSFLHRSTHASLQSKPFSESSFPGELWNERGSSSNLKSDAVPMMHNRLASQPCYQWWWSPPLCPFRQEWSTDNIGSRPPCFHPPCAADHQRQERTSESYLISSLWLVFIRQWLVANSY